MGIQNRLTPQLIAEAENPQGYSPSTLGQMTTAAEQTVGGSNAGAAGSAGLRAERTRNIGSGQAAAAASGRSASEDLSQVNAGIQSQNANLKAKQQQAGLSGLQGMYSTDTGAGLNALGLSNQALNDAGQLSNFWQQLMLQGVKSGGEVAASYAGRD